MLKALREQGIKINCRLNSTYEMLLAEYNSLTKVVSIFEHKLAKGDLIGAINTAVIDADNASHIAQEAIKNIQENKARLNKLAKDTLAKYKPL